MTPVSLFGIITIIFGILAALNYLYFNNIPFTTILTILTVISLGITAFVFFFRDDD